MKTKELLLATHGELAAGKTNAPHKNVVIDSHNINKGDVFVAIKGERFDGHDFIAQAVKNGASAVIISNGGRNREVHSQEGPAIIVVKDTLKALQDIAAYHRSKFNIPVIGVTGSVGKTTTKDMIASILSQEFNTLKNEENLNNEIGVPLTLLRLKKSHKAAVIEMGMQALGEIDILAKIAKPTIAVITNIGEAHLKYLKTTKNIARAKSEIFNYMSKTGYAVINQDDEYFEHLAAKAKVNGPGILTFGILEKSDITPKELEGINLPTPGQHNIYNALAAIAAARILKIGKKSIKKGLEIFTPSGKRMEVINCKNGIKVINDTYNANPQSMAASIEVLSDIPGRKIAVLGDMLELGPRSKTYHKKIAMLAKKLGIDIVLLFGDKWPDKSYSDKKILIKKLKTIIKPSDIILVKGSRGMRMEDIVSQIIN